MPLRETLPKLCVIGPNARGSIVAACIGIGIAPMVLRDASRTNSIRLERGTWKAATTRENFTCSLGKIQCCGNLCWLCFFITPPSTSFRRGASVLRRSDRVACLQ